MLKLEVKFKKCHSVIVDKDGRSFQFIKLGQQVSAKKKMDFSNFPAGGAKIAAGILQMVNT